MKREVEHSDMSNPLIKLSLKFNLIKLSLKFNLIKLSFKSRLR